MSIINNMSRDVWIGLGPVILLVPFKIIFCQLVGANSWLVSAPRNFILYLNRTHLYLIRNVSLHVCGPCAHELAPMGLNRPVRAQAMGHSSIILTYCHQYKMQFIVFYHNIKVLWLHSKHSGQEPRRAGGPLTRPSRLVAKEGQYGKKKMQFCIILYITHWVITVTCLNSIPTFQKCPVLRTEHS